jgi:hypothetical protein
MSFECLWVLLDLAANCIILLRHFPVLKSNLLEYFSHLAQRVDFTDIVLGAVKKFSSSLLDLDSFLLAIVGVGDAATICKSVVHC